MDKKKPLPSSSSSSDYETTSYEEGSDVGDEQGYVRSDRLAKKAVPEEEEDDEEDDEEDADHDLHHAGKSRNTEHRGASQATIHEAESESDGESSSASQGKSHQTAVAPALLSPKVQHANGHGKAAPLPEKSLKKHAKGDDIPEKGKTATSKRERDDETQAKGSSKKQKGNGGEPSKSAPLPEEVNSEKQTPSHTSDKKKRKKMRKKSEEPEKRSGLPSQEQFAQMLENVASPKEVDKGKVKTKSVKDHEPEPVKEPPSPAKSKIWTPRDELVLSREMLADVKHGGEIPLKKVDGYWSALAQKLEGKLEKECSRDQLCGKVKRMRARYNGMTEKFNDVENPKFRNSSDKELFGLWNQIWGNNIATKEDTGRETNGAMQSKPGVSTSTVSGKKMGSKKGVTMPAPAKENKVVHEESEAPKSKQCDKGSSGTEKSQSDESDDEADSQESEPKGTGKEMEKNTRAHGVLVVNDTAVQGQEKLTTSKSLGDAQQFIEGGIQAALSSIQECARQAVKEWQNRALAMVEDTMKAAADQARLTNGMSPFTPVSSMDLMDWSPSADDAALHNQWYELRLKELEVYNQRLELMQRECQLRQDQLKLQLNRHSK